MRQREEGDSEEEFDIDIPDRAWEHVELSDDDDGEWAERAERRKKVAAAPRRLPRRSASRSAEARVWTRRTWTKIRSSPAPRTLASSAPRTSKA